MALSSEIQGDLVTFLETENPDASVDKYDGQLDVDDIAEAALEYPFILVFYNGSELSSEVEKNALYNARIGFQILVGSNNVATRTAKNDEALDLKDDVVGQLSGSNMSFDSRNYLCRILGDSVLVRDKDVTIVSIRIEITGQR